MTLRPGGLDRRRGPDVLPGGMGGLVGMSVMGAGEGRGASGIRGPKAARENCAETEAVWGLTSLSQRSRPEGCLRRDIASTWLKSSTIVGWKVRGRSRILSVTRGGEVRRERNQSTTTNKRWFVMSMEDRQI